MGLLAAWQPKTFPEFLLAAVVWSLLGIFILLFGFKLFDLLTPKIDFADQLNKGNVAIGIVVGVFLLALAIIIHAAMVA